MLLKCCMFTLIHYCSVVVINAENNIHEVFMKKQSSDLDSSASGYIYRQDGHAPANIVYFNSGDNIANAHHSKPYAPQLFPYVSNANLGHTKYVQPQAVVAYHHQHPTVYTKPIISHKQPPLVYAERYVNKPAPYSYEHKHIEPDHEEYVADSPIVVKEDITDDSADVDDDEDDDVDEDAENHEHYSQLPIDHLERTADHDHHHEKSDGFAKENGSDFNEEHNTKHGKEDASGYKNEDEFSKGEKGHHHDEKHDGYYGKSGGKKSSEFDEGGSYSEHDEGVKGTKGGKYGEKKSHKKGSKTTGYHNVFHKDEYKKDHTFYDDADKSGNFHNYGREHEYHNADAGKHGKGAHHNSGFYADKFGKKGHTDKGHYNNADAGYNKKHGNNQHYAHGSNYAKNGGNQYGNEHGYRQSGGYHH